MAFKIPNFYQKTSPLRQEMTHSGNAIPEGTVFYGGEDGQTPMPKTGAEKALTKTKELLKFNNTNINPDLDLDGDGVEEFFYDHRGQKHKKVIDGDGFDEEYSEMQDEYNKYLEMWKEEDPNASENVKDPTEESNAPKDPQKVNWSEAPPLNTQERTQWYIDNNQGLDHTTPPLTVAETEPEPIEEVMSSEPIVRNNRRTRRRDRIIARNEKAELRNKKAKLRNKGIKGDVKFGDTTLIDGKYVDQDFQDPNIS